MSNKRVEREKMEAWLYGSIILGAGGGGSLDIGRETLDAAYGIGVPTLVTVEEMKAKEGYVVTASAVGAPAAKDQFVKSEDYNRVVELMEDEMGTPPLAFITNELGGGSTFNAFIQSAATGIPMLDAACNGRAHPLGTMGSMGLSEKDGYRTYQTAAGGNPETGRYLEVTAKGTVQQTSALVRTAAVQAGGLVVVARNPVSIDYVSHSAAVGALSYVQKIGEAFLSGTSSEEKIKHAVFEMGGTVIAQGSLDVLELTTVNGLDVGEFQLQSDGDVYRMHICNEYMALEKDGERMHTFPDLLMTFDADTGIPITSSQLKEGQNLALIAVPYQKLLLGAGMYERSGYEAIEEILDIELVTYVEELFTSVGV